VLRFALENADVRIGRDQSNDIWIDNQQVRPQTCLVYAREGAHHLKVFDGAKVLLNGQMVRGLHRLYSGDTILVGDRELMYARDDTPAQIAVGLTILLDGAVQYGMVYRRSRVVLGCGNADLVLNDTSISDQHLIIECYSDSGLFAFDLGSKEGSSVNGRPIDERCRLRDGDVVQLGRVGVRVHLLPIEAHGLLLAAALPERPKVPQGAPQPMDRSPGMRHDPGAMSAQRRQADSRPVAGGFVRPAHSPNAATAAAELARPVDLRPPPPEPLPEPLADVPQPTMIGSLAELEKLRIAQSDIDPLTDRVVPVATQIPVELPAIRIHPQQVRQTAPAPDEGRPPARRGFHDQNTAMLDSADIYANLRGLVDGAVPLTAVLNTELPPPLPPMTREQRMAEQHATREPATPAPDRYRLSKASAAFEPYREPPRPADSDVPPLQADPGAPLDRYRLGRGTGAVDRGPSADERPRLQQRPLSEAERRANPGMPVPQPGEPSPRPNGPGFDEALRRNDHGRDR
jgi:pSer/pThr/pTyr-binding forkhead associated (FHA) protein